MKLWNLYSIKATGPTYDIAQEFVVRASNEHAARAMASGQCGDEGPAVWFNPELTACVELTADGDPEIIVRDFFNG